MRTLRWRLLEIEISGKVQAEWVAGSSASYAVVSRCVGSIARNLAESKASVTAPTRSSHDHDPSKTAGSTSSQAWGGSALGRSWWKAQLRAPG